MRLWTDGEQSMDHWKRANPLRIEGVELSKTILAERAHSDDTHSINNMTEPPKDLISLLQQNISRVVLGKADAVRLAVVALLAGEHVLLEDVPGVGKTPMGKGIAPTLRGRL